MEDNHTNLDDIAIQRRLMTMMSPMNPSNNSASMLSGMTSLVYSPSNIASSTTQSNILNQFIK